MSADAAPVRQVAVSITHRGFEPSRLVVGVGETVELVFTRLVDRTCVKRVIVELDGEHTIERDLPRGQPVAVRLAFERAGELGFRCPMAMHGATIEVR